MRYASGFSWATEAYLPMKINVIPGRKLDAAFVQTWREIQTSNPELCSPYFAPEFTLAVAATRNDIEIAILQDNDKVLGFFPFQREGKTVGKAIGHPLSDYHGLICAPDLDFDPLALLRACELVAWDFDHVLVSQRPFQPFHQIREVSPIIDLSRGFDDYLAERKSTGSGFRRPLQLMRKLEREVGSLSFQSHVNDIALLHFIMRKKSEQYKKSGVPDLFADEWIRQTVEMIFQTQTTYFSGMLSVLYAGHEMVASLMSIKSPGVCHGWFLGFEDRFLSYSPGFIMWLKMAELGGGMGFRYLDFGKGDQPYKQRLMNGSIAVACGSVELPSWLSFQRSANRKFRALVTNSPLAGPTRRIVHWARGNAKSSRRNP
jgi:CelD/BcsL family acetyltransferase involved in cellulose biosynthesis